MPVGFARVDDLEPRQVEAWRELARVAVAPNAWTEPGFLLHALRAWPGGEDVRIAYVEEPEGSWSLALACTIESYALRWRTLSALSTHGEYLSGHAARVHPLVRAGDERASFAALIGALGHDGLPAAIALDRVPEGPVLAGIEDAARDRRAPMLTQSLGAILTAPPMDGTAVWGPVVDGIVGDDRPARDLRKRARRLGDAAGGPVVLEDWTDRDDAIERFIALQGAGWKGDAARGGDGLILHPERAAAFASMAADLRSHGGLRVLALHAGGDPLHIAVYMGTSPSCLHGIYDAYDEQLGRLSPGVVGRGAAVHALARGEHAVEIDPGGDVGGPRMGPAYVQERRLTSVVIAGSGMLDRAHVAAARARARVRS